MQESSLKWVQDNARLSGKAITRELCKTTKWYMHKVKSVLGNETNKILWDYVIQTDQLIPARRPDLTLTKNRIYRFVDFGVPVDNRVIIKEREKRYKYLDLAKELKKTIELEDPGNTNCSCCSRNGPQEPEEKLEELEINGRIETIQTTALLRSTRILRRVLET